MTDFTDHKDLRSASIDTKRSRTRRAKYNNFINTNEGVLNTPYYAIDLKECFPYGGSKSPYLDEWPIIPGLSKRQMFEIAQEATLCRHHGCCPMKRYKCYTQETEIRRGTKAAKKEARAWKGVWRDDGQVDQDCLGEMYLEWYERDAAPAEHESAFDVGPLLKKAEKKRILGEKRLMEKLGWVDAWDDEYWVSDSEGEWVENDPEAAQA